MLVPQLYLNGSCCDDIELYIQAFNAKADSIMYDTQKEPEKFVIHAELYIQGSRIMLSDFWGEAGINIRFYYGDRRYVRE